MKKISIFTISVLAAFFLASGSAGAFLRPHPIQLYEKGEAFVQNYDGNMDHLVSAQDIFVRLILKYPNSPFGYLGMSHIYRIDAYLGDEDYDMKIIRDRALPFALRAMKLGPSIREVHENYAFFEKFFEEDESVRLDFIEQ